MAHEIEMIDGKAQMAFRGDRKNVWHGLGTQVSDDMTPEQMMKAAGLDWDVVKVNTFLNWNGEMIETGRQALVRETDGKVLTEVGPGWNPVQNKEAFDFFTDFVEAGDMVMDTAGSLKEGQIVWALADVRDGFTLFGGDEVKGYLLFSNPHQYGRSIDVKFVLTRVVCNNTIAVALNEKGQRSVKINHRTKFDANQVKNVLGLSHNKLESFKEAAEFLGSKQFTKPDLETYYGNLFGKSKKEDKTLTRTGEKMLELIETQPGADFQKGTWWQALNAVTYANSHVLGRSADSRLTSNWFGAASRKNLEAVDLAVKMAKAA